MNLSVLININTLHFKTIGSRYTSINLNSYITINVQYITINIQYKKTRMKQLLNPCLLIMTPNVKLEVRKQNFVFKATKFGINQLVMLLKEINLQQLALLFQRFYNVC